MNARQRRTKTRAQVLASRQIGAHLYEGSYAESRAWQAANRPKTRYKRRDNAARSLIAWGRFQALAWLTNAHPSINDRLHRRAAAKRARLRVNLKNLLNQVLGPNG